MNPTGKGASIAVLLLALGVGACSSDDASDETDPLGDDPETSDPVGDGANGDDPDGGGLPLLSLEGRRAVLDDVLRVLNADDIEEVFDARPEPSRARGGEVPAGLTLLGVTEDVPGEPLPDVPSVDPADPAPRGPFRRTDYGCDGGGTLAVIDRPELDASPITSLYAIHELCRFGDAVLDGATHERVVGLAQDYVEGSAAAEFSVTAPDGSVRTLSGAMEESSESRVIAERLVRLRDVSYAQQGGARALRASDYDADFEVAVKSGNPGNQSVPLTGPDGTVAGFFEATLDVSLTGGFDIVAAWTGDEPARVAFDLVGTDRFLRPRSDSGLAADDESLGEFVTADGEVADTEPDERFSWDGGSLTIEASDGSTLVIEPTDATAEGIEGPAFAVTAADGSVSVSQEELFVDCSGRSALECRIAD